MYNIFEKQEDINVRNAQIVYMAEELKMEPRDIKQYVDLAIGTIKQYIKKFNYMLELAYEWFGRQINKLLIKRVPYGTIDNVKFECTPRPGYCSYIIEYFDSNNDFIFLKVGMTNDIERRIGEHFKDYRGEFDATYAIVKELHYAKDNENAEILESLYRQHYKAIPDCGFINRDRFANVKYDKQELEQDLDLMSKIKLFEMAAA